MQADPRAILRDCFGYASFREGQEALISRILQGGDVLGIMPTGAGKSVCYQVPAMMLPGLTVVISPLISLMEDQVAALRQAGIPAVCLHSNLDSSSYFQQLSQARAGQIRLLYAAPERLLTDSFLALSEQQQIAMVAVDEAHCLSQWGQDFRPGYLDIAEYLKRLPRRPVVAAFTATATEAVRADIRRLLGLQNPLELVTGFDRENLRWILETPRSKYPALQKHLRRLRGKSGIVYCISRRQTDEVCEKLCTDGYAAVRYHAGLSAEERAANQDAFLRDAAQIMVATNAFGMGIDKSNVSFVIHYNCPKSMEAYYQEAGRAGRDGMPAECILLYSPQDIRINRMLIDAGRENDRLTPEQREAVHRQDLERLNAMVRYGGLSDCLRHYILGYFGERAPAECGNCSNCLSAAERRDVTVSAQKILSCVYRAAQRGLNCSAPLLCDVLLGKKSDRITVLRLDTLSTYGLLAGTPRSEIERMVQHLIAHGALRVDTEQYNALILTPRANPILRGQEKVEIRFPQQEPPRREKRQRETKSGRPVQAVSLEMPEFAETDSLFERLRRVRERIAAKEYVPAYIIFSDATLHAMAEQMPADEEQLLAVPGVGRYKLGKYGSVFLQTVAEYVKENG